MFLDQENQENQENQETRLKIKFTAKIEWASNPDPQAEFNQPNVNIFIVGSLGKEVKKFRTMIDPYAKTLPGREKTNDICKFFPSDCLVIFTFRGATYSLQSHKTGYQIPSPVASPKNIADRKLMCQLIGMDKMHLLLISECPPPDPYDDIPILGDQWKGLEVNGVINRPPESIEDMCFKIK